MTRWSVRKKLVVGLAAIVLIANVVAAWCAFSMRRASMAMSELAQQQLPELALATAFEREILNARIHFIYHVTIQKPGALDSGWERFRNARALIPKLSQQVAASSALGRLRGPTEQLAADLDQYEEALRRTLAAMSNRQTTGPGLTDLITEWAGVGARVVNGAAELQRLCSEATAASNRCSK